MKCSKISSKDNTTIREICTKLPRILPKESIDLIRSSLRGFFASVKTITYDALNPERIGRQF